MQVIILIRQDDRKLLQNEVNSKTGKVTSPKCVWILVPWGPQQYRLSKHKWLYVLNIWGDMDP